MPDASWAAALAGSAGEVEQRVGILSPSRARQDDDLQTDAAAGLRLAILPNLDGSAVAVEGPLLAGAALQKIEGVRLRLQGSASGQERGPDRGGRQHPITGHACSTSWSSRSSSR